MLEFTPQHDNVAELIIGGSITAADYDRIRPEFESFAEEHDGIRLLLEVRELDDVGIRAVLEDLKLTTEYLRDFERVAMVSDKAWHQTLAKTFGAVTPGEVKTFGLDDRSAAEAWLEE